MTRRVNQPSDAAPLVVIISSDEEPCETAELGEQLTSIITGGGVAPLEDEGTPEVQEPPSGADLPAEQQPASGTESARRPCLRSWWYRVVHRIKSLKIQPCGRKLNISLVCLPPLDSSYMRRQSRASVLAVTTRGQTQILKSVTMFWTLT